MPASNLVTACYIYYRQLACGQGTPLMPARAGALSSNLQHAICNSSSQDPRFALEPGNRTCTARHYSSGWNKATRSTSKASAAHSQAEAATRASILLLLKCPGPILCAASDVVKTHVLVINAVEVQCATASGSYRSSQCQTCFSTGPWGFVSLTSARTLAAKLVLRLNADEKPRSRQCFVPQGSASEPPLIWERWDPNWRIDSVLSDSTKVSATGVKQQQWAEIVLDWKSMCIQKHTHTHAMHACIHTYTYIHYIRLHYNTYIHACMPTYIDVSMYVCSYCMNTYITAHTCILYITLHHTPSHHITHTSHYTTLRHMTYITYMQK